MVIEMTVPVAEEPTDQTESNKPKVHEIRLQSEEVRPKVHRRRIEDALGIHIPSGAAPVLSDPLTGHAKAPAQSPPSVEEEDASPPTTSSGRDAATVVNEPCHPDGPEAPHWLWLQNKRVRIGTDRSRLSWFLLKYFWEREAATYEDLQGLDKPWFDPVSDSAIATAVNRFNNDMPKGLPWVLATKNRWVYKKSRQNPAK
jgi:hypothetical protein